jgi:hypothetical protein
MGNVISLNGRRDGAFGAFQSFEFYDVLTNGLIRYNSRGISEFSQMFREHGIDIRKIESEDDHRTALDICASQSVIEVSGQPGVDQLEVQLLRAIMMNSDNQEAQRVEKRIKLRDKLRSDSSPSQVS